MKPTNRLFLFALIIFLFFGTAPVVHAAVNDVTCDQSPQTGFIDQGNKEDIYNIWLDADQKLIIDIDAEKIGSTLDSYLVVSNSNGDTVDVSDKSTDVAPDSLTKVSEDPYLEITAVVSDTYILTISAAGDGTSAADEGSYTLLFECFDPGQPTSQEFKWPEEAGDLIGSTGSASGSLINIAPDTAASSSPFDLGVGRIADIEFDPNTKKLFVAINESPGSIITFDTVTGDQDQTYNLVPVTETIPTVVALEAVGNTLYGVQVDSSSGEEVGWVLVSMDITPATATLTDVISFNSPVRSLAYNPSEQILYGASGTNLIKIDLASTPVGIEEITLTGLSVQIVALDFSHEDVLYGVDGSGNLFYVPDLSTGLAEIIGSIDVSTSPEGISGLTFVVGEPPDVDPIKTICSSTLTSSASASSGTAAPKLSRFKLKKNPLHRAIGLFKFTGKAGETITLNAKAEEEESVEAVVEESSANEMENPWLNYWKGKGRVFLGIRDAIPDLDFRVRKKDRLPLAISATLPADGTYYVMVIRPLLRYYQTDYCLTLESDFQDSQAWESLEVAWPEDESEDDTACTTAEESKDIQNDTETLAGASADDGSVSVSLSTTAIEPTSAPPEEIIEEKTGDVPTEEMVPVENPREPVDVDEDESEGVSIDVSDAAVEEPIEVSPEEPAAGGGDTEVVQTVGNETPVVEPVDETPAVQEPVDDTGSVEVPPDDNAVSGGETSDEPAADTTVEEPTGDTGSVETQPDDDAVSGDETSDEPVADTTVEEPVVETVDEPVVKTPVETDPAGEGLR